MLDKLLSPILMLTLVLTLSTPKKSEAVIGTLAPSVGFTVLAAVTAGGSIYSGVRIALHQRDQDRLFLGIVLGALTAAAGSYLGLIFLDDQKTVNFSTMTSVDAKRLGVSETERQKFNNELEEANFVFDDIKYNAEGLSNSQLANMWQDYAPTLSAETFSTIKKISNSL